MTSITPIAALLAVSLFAFAKPADARDSTPSRTIRPDCLVEELKRTEGYMPPPPCGNGPVWFEPVRSAAPSQTSARHDCLTEELKRTEGYVPPSSCGPAT